MISAITILTWLSVAVGGVFLLLACFEVARRFYVKNTVRYFKKQYADYLNYPWADKKDKAFAEYVKMTETFKRVLVGDMIDDTDLIIKLKTVREWLRKGQKSE